MGPEGTKQGANDAGAPVWAHLLGCTNTHTHTHAHTHTHKRTHERGAWGSPYVSTAGVISVPGMNSSGARWVTVPVGGKGQEGAT